MLSKKKLISLCLFFAIMISLLSTSGIAYAYTNAFDTNQSKTFNNFINDAGWNRGRINSPPNPKTGGTWTSLYGGDQVYWQDAYQTELYYDGIYGTTGPYVWDVDSVAFGSSGTLATPTGSGSNIVEMARSQLGTTEQGTNRVAYVDWYLGGSPGNYVPWEWCCIFVLWCANQFGYVGSVFEKTASCSEMFRWMTEDKGYSRITVREAWQGEQTILPGDILLFYAGGKTFCHIGIIEEVGPNNSYIQTIEGNTSGSFDPNGGRHSVQGVYRQRYTPSSNYPAMQNGYIVRPNYPA